MASFSQPANITSICNNFFLLDSQSIFFILPSIPPVYIKSFDVHSQNFCSKVSSLRMQMFKIFIEKHQISFVFFLRSLFCKQFQNARVDAILFLTKIKNILTCKLTWMPQEKGIYYSYPKLQYGLLLWSEYFMNNARETNM